MLVLLNGYPGVGKTAIGRIVAERMPARFLDIHTVYNVAFALTEFRTPAFYDTVRAVAAVADARIRALPAGEPVVLTTVLTEGPSDWAREEWARLSSLGAHRAPFVVVHLHCALPENERRIASPERIALRKPRDPEMARRNHAGGRPLAGGDLPHLLRLDITKLSPVASAERILRHLEGVTPGS